MPLRLDLEHDAPQGTDEWRLIRLGHPTASRFDEATANGRGGEPSRTALRYATGLSAERITGRPMSDFQSADMRRGHELEPEARAWYAIHEMADVRECGHFYCPDRRVGATPDGVVDGVGILEIKTHKPEVFADMMNDLDAGIVPARHVKQVQGELWVTGAAWCDVVVYWPGLRPWIVRAEPDPAYWEAELIGKLVKFNKMVDSIEESQRKRMK